MNRPDLPSSAQEQLQTANLFSGPRLEEGAMLSQRFRITRRLGQGAQGLVYLAKDELLDTDIAIKVIEGCVTDPHQMTILRNEVNIARQLQHPNIIRVHDVFCDGDLAFFTMEFVSGEPLYERIQEGISKADFDLWRGQLIEAISACQSVGIKHGDIKPDNILVDAENNLRLIDFGIGQNDNMFSQTSGHHQYTAPEVLHTGIANEQSDVYSAGKVLEDMFLHVKGGRFSASKLLWKFNQKRLISRLTAKNPHNRPALHSLTTEKADSTRSILTILTTSVILFVGIIVYLALPLINKPIEKMAADHPVQMVILPHPDYPLLDTISELLRYPLSTHPDIALVSQQQTLDLINNLALNPAENDTQRVDLAAILAADTLLLLDATPTTSQSYLLHATVLSMPANQPIFSTSASVSANTLPEDLTVFANELIDTLFSSLNTDKPLPNLDYLQALDIAWQKGEMLSASQSVDAIISTTPDYPGGWVAKANLAIEQGDFATAKKALDQLDNLPKLEEYWTLQSALIRAQIYDDLQLAKQAINALVSAYPNRADLLATRADIHQWAGDDSAAMADYSAAISLRPNDGQLWFELARLQIINGDIETATSDTLTKALVAFRRVKNTVGESLVLNGFGVAHMRMAENETAIKYFQDSLMLRRADTQPSERAKTLANLALATSMIGRYENAESALKEALTLLHELGDLHQEAHIHDSLGFLYEEQGFYKDALSYYKQGLDLRVQIDDKSLQPESMSNVAYMHFLIGDLSLAEIYWQQALSLFEQNGDKSHLLRTYQNLAQLSLVKGNNTVATRYLTKVANNITKENEQERMYNYLLYSFLHFATGNRKEAFENIMNAEVLAQENSDLRAFVEINLWKAEACLKIADWQCTEDTLKKIEGDISPQSHEQYAVYQWLNLSLTHHTVSPVNDESQVYNALVDTTNIPVITEIKILLDMQQRLALDINSDAMKKSSQLMKTSFYQPHLEWLYIKAKAGDEKARYTLEQQITLHDAYWRNHIYYSIIPGNEARQLQLTSQWLSGMTEDQAKNYRKAYLE